MFKGVTKKFQGMQIIAKGYVVKENYSLGVREKFKGTQGVCRRKRLRTSALNVQELEKSNHYMCRDDQSTIA